MFGLGKVVVDTDSRKIDAILDRGVIVDILPTKELFKGALLRGQRLRMYMGVDPTSTALHLSHAKNYMLLEEFRKLGHEVIAVFGDFTAQIGDPSDRGAARAGLSREEIKKNVASWLKQIRPLLNFTDRSNPARVRYNSKWLSKLTFEDVVHLASNFTVQHMIERDMFERRMRSGKPIHLHEFLYPLMQGYDSVAMEVDVELGGTDQTFNMLAGRTLLKKLKDKEKFVVVVNLMENPRTGAMMSKSRGTGVFLDTTPAEMFGAVMAESDEMMKILFVNCTRVPLSDIEHMERERSTGRLHPRDMKMRLAREIVTLYHGEAASVKAEKDFTQTFRKGGLPKDTKGVTVKKGTPLSTVLVDAGVVASKNEFRRLIHERGISSMEGEKITNHDFVLEKNVDVKIGKRRFLKIEVR